MEGLDVLEDRVGELDAGVPSLPVEQLGLHAAPERFHDGVVVGIADAAQGGQQPGFAARSVNVHEVNWVPWSPWMIPPAAGLRESMAMPSALAARSARWDESMAQPTTRRDQTSSTTQQYTLPSRVGCSVMSVTHSWFGPLRRKSRRTRSVMVPGRLVRLPRVRAGSAARLARRISRLTVRREVDIAYFGAHAHMTAGAGAAPRGGAGRPAGRDPRRRADHPAAKSGPQTVAGPGQEREPNANSHARTATEGSGPALMAISDDGEGCST